MAENPATNLQALWQRNEGRFRNSRDLIDTCAKWNRQDRSTYPRIPSKDGIAQGFALVLPHSTTMPQDVAAFVARREPSLRRTPIGGGGSRAQKQASEVEEWLAAAMKDKVKIDDDPLWPALCSIATHDSEHCVLVQPAVSHYSGLLTLLEDDNSTIRAVWRRNKDGLTVEDYEAKNGSRSGFTPSKRKSREAQEEYARKYKANRWPLIVRLLTAGEYLPLGKDPLTGRLDEVLIRSVCSATHLESQGFKWWSHTTGGTDEANVEGHGQSYWLYELHKGNPWRIIYELVGLNGDRYYATKDGLPVQKGWDGSKYCKGALPAKVGWGWHRPHEKDPDKRGIPLLAPFLGVIGGAQVSMTGIIEHLHKTGFGGWGQKISPEMIDIWTEMGRPTQFDMQDNAISLLLGDPVSLVHQGAGPDAWRVVEFLFGLVERFNEGERVRSNPDASSISQTTALASVDTVLGQITHGALNSYRFVAECLLEQAQAIAEETGAPIPVYCTQNKQGDEQTHVEIGADHLMGDFTVEIFQPTRKATNLPRAQAMLSWADAGKISDREWLEEGYGLEQPEEMLDEVAAEQYLKSETGQAELQAMVARIKGDRDRQKLQQMQQSGDVTEGGVPSVMVPPRGGPANGVAPNGVPMGMPNPAASSLGGQVAAAVNPGAVTNVVTATGTGPEMGVP